MDEFSLQKGMTDSQRMMFQAEMASVRKDPMVAFLFTLFLGGLGAHWYYMGRIGLGLIYTLFCWTLIPGIVAFVELFLIQKRVVRFNNLKAQEIAKRVTA